MMKTNMRRNAIITGADGGMGQACARAFGATMNLVLTDLSQERLDAFADALRAEGHVVTAAIAGDLRDQSVAQQIADAAATGGGLGVLIHAAGLSPALAAWEAIMQVNAIGTANLLHAISPLLQNGSVAVLISSIAGHAAPADAEADMILSAPLTPDFMARITPVIYRLADRPGSRGASVESYGLSKRMTIRICERLAPEWAMHGARIVSISPGMIWTPMGRQEASTNSSAAMLVDNTPMARWGTPMDIAAAACFLAGDTASFITGTDLCVDGGITALGARLRPSD